MIKKIKELLQGKPFNHPIHPILVHFPIGLFVFSLLLDLATLLVEDAGPLFRGAFYTMALGIVTALVAAIPGLVDWVDIRSDHPARQTATYHMLLNFLAVGLYVVNLGLRLWVWNEPKVPVLPLVPKTPFVPLVLSLGGVGVLAISGYLGGVLVYDDGISVGRHRRYTRTPRETLRVSPDGAEEGYVPVAEADSLPNRETLRVEVDGQVMTLINLNGKFYALQEFCTHHFGPLSEGSFRNGQVECPWHRSCFDVRTGKVTQGPAKVDLKTYKISVRDGKIWVRVPKEETPAGER